MELKILDRISGQMQIEKVYGGKGVDLFYGDSWLSHLLHPLILPWIAGSSLFSRFYGWMQKQPSSRKKIAPFIRDYGVDVEEFRDPVESFQSFNEFFIRHLKAEARPICAKLGSAVIPADGRYRFFQQFDQCEGIVAKGQKFTLAELLQDETLAQTYAEGSMVMARLCPFDYHRFHFPCACVPSETKVINGYLHSVNPVAIKRNVKIFTQNKRTLCELQTEDFGRILYLEIGALNVGSIRETYTSYQPQPSGAEKGYFEFGGSALILLFEKERIRFDDDLVAATKSGIEIRCLLGQHMGQRP